MIKIKSFQMTDDKGMNELLSKYRIAEGSSMLISNGVICIPYEDGEEMNIDQQINFIKTQRNRMNTEADLMVHSQLVLETQVKGIKDQMSALDEKIVKPTGSKEYKDVKKFKDELKRLENVLSQTENQMIMNQAELTRLMTNIKVFNQRIESIEKTGKTN